MSIKGEKWQAFYGRKTSYVFVGQARTSGKLLSSKYAPASAAGGGVEGGRSQLLRFRIYKKNAGPRRGGCDLPFNQRGEGKRQTRSWEG